MAFSYFFNMEKLSLSIAQEHIQGMTEDMNYIDNFFDDDKLINNLKNGFVELTMLNSFIESFVNTIIDSCMKYDGEVLLKCSIDEKIEIIFMYYGKDFRVLKSKDAWGTYKSASKVRNELIHFKKSYIGDGTGTPDFMIGKQRISDFFIRSKLEKIYEKYIELTDLIANMIGLKIYKEIGVFGCDGKDGLVNYVFNPEEIIVDDDRFE